MVMFYFSANYHIHYIIKLLANVFIFVSCTVVLVMKRGSPLYLHFNCDFDQFEKSVWISLVCNGEGVDFMLILMFSVSFVDPTKNWAKSSTNSWHIEGPSKHGVLCSKPDFFEQSISLLKDWKCFKDSKWSGLGLSRPLRRSHSVSTESRKSIVLNTKKIQKFCDTCCYFSSKCSSNVSIHSITINSVYFDD